MYGVCKTYGRKSFVSKILNSIKRKDGYKMFSTISFPHEWGA